MEYSLLGKTGLKVSKICLGTMTWGQQNSEAEAHEQLDYALDQGVNFIDTAEMYPVPPKAETQGRTEQFIGSWLKQGKRDKVVLATKVAGPGREMTHMRGGPKLDRDNIMQAIDTSLQRLHTDYVDLYQVHWPGRSANFFGQLGYSHKPSDQEASFVEVLEAMNDLVKAGKIRYFGISNETPWGAMQYVSLADHHGLPRVQSIQNPYNLLNRTYEVGMAEVSMREQAGLLAYSPLAFGVLSGKYLDGARPEQARLTLFDRFVRYTSELGQQATAAYVALARNYGLDPAQMALAFVNNREFVTSNIIGATSMTQLADNIASIELKLSDELLSEIEQVHQRLPNPCP